jgi:hypothetical protein|tara:strand:+ start:257 stop:427 length:171 start_codon:yes stop_codon:yes gene_type:complete
MLTKKVYEDEDWSDGSELYCQFEDQRQLELEAYYDKIEEGYHEHCENVGFTLETTM